LPEGFSMSKKALGKGLPKHIKDREMKSEFQQVIDAWRAEGYNVQRLDGILDLDMDTISQAFALFDNDIKNLKDIAEIVDMMETAGFEQEIQSIRQKLKDPEMITEVLQEVHELDSKIKTRQSTEHKQVVDKKVDEWQGTLQEGKDELMDLWAQSEQESMVKDPGAVREAASKVEDPTDAAIEDRLSNLRSRLNKLSLDQSIPLRSDKIGMLKDKLSAVGSGPAETEEQAAETSAEPEAPAEEPPAEEPPAEEQPAEEPPTEEPPTEEPPTEEPPTEEPPTEEPPTEEPPAEVPPVEEPPVEEPPVEEPPVEEPPVEEPPAEEPPAEEPPAEEPPAEVPVEEPPAQDAEPGPEPAAQGPETEPEPEPAAPETPAAPEPVELTPEQKEDVEEAINMAKEMYRNKEYQKAIEYFDMALEMDPANSDAIFFRKRAEYKLE
jgi:tetratricopeptide (TPR) repeat protein